MQEFRAIFRRHSLTLDESSRERAEHYVRHEFDVLGSGWVRVRYGMETAGFLCRNYSNRQMNLESLLSTMPQGQQSEAQRLMALARSIVPGYEPMDWHIDIKSGYRTELRPADELSYGAVEGVDLKVTADLSRGYQFPQLAIAWRATGDWRYGREILAQMLDWLAANPTGFGPGWRANMNVGIRAINWIVALHLLQDGLDLREPAWREASQPIEKSLREHQQWIAAHLEFPEGHFHPNHYVSNLVALLLVSMRCPEADPKGAWQRLAWRELRLQIDHQIAADVLDFEGATAYHAFVLEMLAVGLLLSARMDGQFHPQQQRAWLAKHLGDERLRVLHKMFLALCQLTPPSGQIPLVGDNDSGRLVYLESPVAPPRDWRFLSCVGAALFEDPALLPEVVQPAHWSATRWLVDSKPLSVTPGVGRDADAAFPNTGFYVLRGAGAYVLVSAGPIGTGGVGGHAHNDRLAFTLEIDGLEFLVDPGVFVYTASREERNAARSVLKHNTLAVSGEEQNRWLESSPWWGCHDDTRCRCVAWEMASVKTLFIGEHLGYQRLNPPVVHRRTIELQKPRAPSPGQR